MKQKHIIRLVLMAFLIAFLLYVLFHYLDKTYTIDHNIKSNMTNEINQYLYYKDGNLRIAHKYNKNYDMWIDFKPCGINSIYALDSIYLIPNENDKTSSNLTKEEIEPFFQSPSDWIGPYIVKSRNHEDNITPFFTGGWHGITQNEREKPTARTATVTIKADKKEIIENKCIPCDKVQLLVTNYIQGYNTTVNKLEIIKENVYYTIFNNKINIDVEIEALDDITILRYYGLQTVNTKWDGQVTYINTQNDAQTFNTYTNNNSQPKKENPDVHMIRLISQDQKHQLNAWIDGKIGLGNFEYLSPDLPCAFSLDYGKSYFNLIHGIEKNLDKGNKVNWKGSYRFLSLE